MTVALTLPTGEGEALRLEGERLEIISPTAFAPGQPLSFTAGALHLEARSQGSKKRDDGRFDVRLRLINFSRVKRERLEELL